MTITRWIGAVAAIFVLLLMGVQRPVEAKEYVTHFTHANGTSIAYQDIGDPGDPAVVLIMGLGAQLITWPDMFIDELTHAGFRVIRFDNRDVGLSQKLYELGEPSFLWAAIKDRLGLPLGADYTLDDMAEDTVGLMDVLEIESAHVVGSSMGGMIAQLVVGHHPERSRSLVSIMSSSGAEDLPEPGGAVMEVIMQPRPKERDAAIERAFDVFATINNGGVSDPDALRAFVTLAYDRCYYPPGVSRQMMAIWAGGSRVGVLKTIRVPTLVIHGTDDPLVPVQHGKDTAARIPGARLQVIEGMAHGLPAFSREIVSTLVQSVVEYLTSVEASIR
jgi:proline iminopeptidase